jgi:hypothetical protein
MCTGRVCCKWTKILATQRGGTKKCTGDELTLLRCVQIDDYLMPFFNKNHAVTLPAFFTYQFIQRSYE